MFSQNIDRIDKNITVNSSGFISFVTQPKFFVYLSADQNNVTGNSTNYVIPYNTAVTNVGGSFNTGTNSFVVPSTGVYELGGTLALSGIGASMNAMLLQLYINSSPSTYLYDLNPLNMSDFNGNVVLPWIGRYSLTAAQTVQILVTVYNGALAVDVMGTNALFRCTFWGQLTP